MNRVKKQPVHYILNVPSVATIFIARGARNLLVVVLRQNPSVKHTTPKAPGQ